MPSSPDSSSDSSTGSPGNHGNHYSDGPNPEVESCLPGVVSRFSCARHYARVVGNNPIPKSFFAVEELFNETKYLQNYVFKFQ